MVCEKLYSISITADNIKTRSIVFYRLLHSSSLCVAIQISLQILLTQSVLQACATEEPMQRRWAIDLLCSSVQVWNMDIMWFPLHNHQPAAVSRWLEKPLL